MLCSQGEAGSHAADNSGNSRQTCLKKGSEGVGLHCGTASYNALFLVALNLRNSKLLIKNIADKMFVAWYYKPRLCAARIQYPQRTLYGRTYIPTA